MVRSVCVCLLANPYLSSVFLQAARVTDAAQKLKATGPEIRSRPMQYVSTSQLELDSYLQLTQAVKLRVRGEGEGQEERGREVGG